LSDFKQAEFSRMIFAKYQISWKSVHWESCSSTRTDGRMDRQKWRS